MLRVVDRAAGPHGCGSVYSGTFIVRQRYVGSGSALALPKMHPPKLEETPKKKETVSSIHSTHPVLAWWRPLGSLFSDGWHVRWVAVAKFLGCCPRPSSAAFGGSA